jgi:hypothetical protein
MKTWMKSVVPLFVLAIAPLARADAPGDQAMASDSGVVGSQETGSSSPQASRDRDLRDTVDRLAREVADLQTKQEARNTNMGDATDHGGWW